MLIPSYPSLEVLESRTLLSQVESCAPELKQTESEEMSWGQWAAIGGGMLAYGGFFFIAAEGGEIKLTTTSAIVGACGLLVGYHVGAGIAVEWMGS